MCRGPRCHCGYDIRLGIRDGADGEVGFALRGGYGFTDRWDGELAVAFYDTATLFGGNLEVALLGAGSAASEIDLSVRGGVHLVQGDLADGTGLDLAGLLSTHLTPKLELVGSLDYNQNFYDEPLEDVSTLHLVPGIEYRLSRRLDLLAESGLG